MNIRCMEDSCFDGERAFVHRYTNPALGIHDSLPIVPFAEVQLMFLLPMYFVL